MGWPMRVALAVLAGGYILFHGTRINLFRAMHTLDFYISFSASFAGALLIISCVHYASVRMDRSYDWLKKPVTRTVFQVPLGVIVPAFIDFLLMSVFFNLLGRDIFKSGFMLVDFPVIVCLIVMLNLYYLIHYLLQATMYYKNGRQAADAHPDGQQILETSPEGGIAAPEAEPNNMRAKGHPIITNVEEREPPADINDVCFFYRYNELNRMVLTDGSHYLISLTLDKLEQLYPEPALFRINRQVLISKAIFQGDSSGYNTRKNTLNIHPRYLDHSKGVTEDLFTVGRSRIKDFKEWGLG